MLVLTRRIGEKIVIDGVISVTVVAIRGDKVRLGVNAPPSILVDRSEIHERRRAARRSQDGREDQILGRHDP